jgi:hypothetical protein
MKLMKRKPIVHDRAIDLENDVVLRKMLEVGATLDLEAYCQFAMIDPADLEAEGLAQIPDVILANTKRLQ